MKLNESMIVLILIFFSNLILGQGESLVNDSLENIETPIIEELVIKVEKDIELHGTLITPGKVHDRIVIIISGTGNISQEAHSHLTESLLENNIGVFRFDKRGVGKSTGRTNEDHQIYSNDFIQIYTHIKNLKKAADKKIGLLGHSLGGIVTIQAIERNVQPDFLIQWSTPIGKPREIIEYQIRNGIRNYDNILIGETIEDRIQLLEYVHNLIDKNPKKNTWDLWKLARKDCKKQKINKRSFEAYLMPSIVEFARIDNSKTYKQLNFPTLIIIGEEDILVDPIASRKKIEEFNNVNIEFKSFQRLNHFLEEGNPFETKYWTIDEIAKKYIIDWILKN